MQDGGVQGVAMEGETGEMPSRTVDRCNPARPFSQLLCEAVTIPVTQGEQQRPAEDSDFLSLRQATKFVHERSIRLV